MSQRLGRFGDGPHQTKVDAMIGFGRAGVDRSRMSSFPPGGTLGA
jgi:hypothetical protein